MFPIKTVGKESIFGVDLREDLVGVGAGGGGEEDELEEGGQGCE